MKNLILIRGVSGSGKSTLAELMRVLGNLNCDKNVFSISADDYFTDKLGNYNFNPSKLTEAHIFCQMETQNAMQGGTIPVICIHNTFTEEWEMKPYFNLAAEHGYRVTTLIIENRHTSKSIHNVPDAVIERQKERFNIKL